MHKILSLFTLLLTCLGSLAQTRAVIKGKVVDSVNNMPMELATVAVLAVKDTTSSLIAYTASDKKGNFMLHNIPAGIDLKLLITFVGYKPYRKLFGLQKGETFDLGVIQLSINQLKEVVVIGERPPIVIRKDTIEFNTEAFKTRPNALVEDLLKKLPGIEVTSEGFVLFNGKAVDKILVDGHEYFMNDTRIATKNLNADMIDKVQVYDNRQNDPNHLLADAQVKKIINLKFKKAYKKSIFGKVYGGAGSEGRYTAGGLVNLFRDTLQVSLLAIGNNLNNTGFSINDLYTQGGLDRGGAGVFSRGLYGATSGIQNIISSGFNINTDYGEKLKINLVYYYSRANNSYNSLTNRQQFLNDTDFTTNSNFARQNISNSHNLSAQVRIQPNLRTQITYSPSFSYSDNQSNSLTNGNSFSNVIPEVSRANGSDHSTASAGQFQQSFDYNHQFNKEGESISLSHSLTISPGSGSDYSISKLTSYAAGLSSFDLNRFNNSINKNDAASVGINYSYPISKKLAANIAVSGAYNHQVNNVLTYDFDAATNLYDSFLQTLSYNLTRNLFTENVNPGLRYNFIQGYVLTAGINTQLLRVNNQFDRHLPDIDQDFLNFLPTINLAIKSFNLQYAAGFSLPNIGDMIPYTVVSSPLFQVTGNPKLKPATRANYSANFNSYGQQSQINVFINASASFERNGVFRERTLNAFGAETSMPINMDGRHMFSVNGGIGKRFRKYKDVMFSESTHFTAGTSHGFLEINQQHGFQNTYNVNLTQQMELNWKDIIDLTQVYTLSSSIADYAGIHYNSQKNTTHLFDSHFNIYWPKRIALEGTYTYIYNPLVSPGFQKSTNLVNLSISRALLKNDRGEIKLTCYDVLNQNIAAQRSISENIISDTQSQVLRRYFLLTLQFRFSKSIVKSPNGTSTNDTLEKKTISPLIFPMRMGQ